VLVIAVALLAAHSFGVRRIVVDNTSLVLLVLVLISPFVAAIRKIKIGEFEAEIAPEEVKRIAQQVEQSLPEPSPKETAPPETGAAAEAISRLAESDPVVALAKLRIELESRLRRLLDKVNPDVSRARPSSLVTVIKNLAAADLFAAEFGAALRDVIAICNRAIHGEDIRDVDARQIVNTGIELLEALERIVREYGTTHPVETSIIGQDERDAFRNGRYRMTTIVPLVNEPRQHVYVLTQDELDSYFDGYQEFAEFVVALERIG
jgi:hypothetical protein